ncbi:MAG TPA: hypothetical protein VFU02_01345, partial [Polyangiaceae bacterium]|nr:hypothetical protein [Polyangiaceae bacterium]
MNSRFFVAVLALASSHCSGGGSTTADSDSGGPSGGAGGAGSTVTASGGAGDSGGSSAGGSGGGSAGGSGGSSAGGAAVGETWLDEPGELPPTLEETGLYDDLSDLNSYNRRAVPFRPEHALWTNGSLKQRFVVVPEGAQIDTSDRGAWQFPENTLFFKTFSYADAEAADGVRPIETRVLKKTATGWEYHAYLWADDRSTAELLDGIHTTPVEVEYEGERFDHIVPARLDCRKCHESQPVGAIGFDELRLNTPFEEGGSITQLEALVSAGLLTELPDDPDAIEHEDETSARVLGYLQGNCAHCHNGWSGPSSAFDLRHDVAFENLINVD